MNECEIVLSYLQAMNDHSASDLYLTVDSKPLMRVDDKLVEIGEDVLEEQDVHTILDSVLLNKQKYEFDTVHELNSSLDFDHYGRFRLNAFQQKMRPSIVLRRINTTIPTISELKLPDVLHNIAMERRGLVLLTGMTGSGKSTTLASMTDYRNRNSSGHIITIEDPIEYYHQHHRCVVSQREVGVDTESYAVAMKNSLRQRPDVILVGEVRDQEVMNHALMSAETGHLCLSTVHASNAYQAIDRIVNFFPEDAAVQIRANLSTSLKAIISQRLVPSIDGGLVPVVEILQNQGLIRELIRTGKIGEIRNVMEQNVSMGMQTFDQCLINLLKDGLITHDTAYDNADNPSDLKSRLQDSRLFGEESDDEPEVADIRKKRTTGDIVLFD